VSGSPSDRARNGRHAVMTGRETYLRYPTRADRGEYMTVRLDSRAHLEPWEATPPNGPDPFSPEHFKGFLETCNGHTSHRLLVCLGGSGEIIGQIGLGGILRGPFESCFVGYWLAAHRTGRGYMSEALDLGLAFAFDRLALHRVEANIMPENDLSKALVGRLGFRFEGLARRYLRINGRWRDHEHWAMTVEEWRARPRPDDA